MTTCNGSVDAATRAFPGLAGSLDTVATQASDGVVCDALALASGRRLPLSRNKLSIGRAPTNDVVLDDPTIADRHAWLQRLPAGWVLIDLGSRDGTAVNGAWVSRPVYIAPGDTIQLGRLVLTFDSRGGHGGERGQPPARHRPGAAAASPAAARALGAAPRRHDVPLIQLRHVVKTYPTSAGPRPVLREVSLAVYAGEFVAIVGPSGCGKSTLLNVLTGIDRPDAGEVILDGQDLRSLAPDALVRWRGRRVGIVFQFFQLLPTLTVAENVMLPMVFCRTYPGAQRRARALEVLDQVGMAHMADRLPNALSGGEQQRVAIARALANNPPVLIADEPTGNLDGQTGRQIFDLFAGLVAAGTTVVMVTHDSGLARRVPRRVEMMDGSIVRAI